MAAPVPQKAPPGLLRKAVTKTPTRAVMLRLDEMPDELKALMKQGPEVSAPVAPAERAAPRPKGPAPSHTMLLRRAFGPEAAGADTTRTGAKLVTITDLPTDDS